MHHHTCFGNMYDDDDSYNSNVSIPGTVMMTMSS